MHAYAGKRHEHICIEHTRTHASTH
eukprot:COSAG02_NODE_68641_length_232_cov_7.263158_1_plen_24_part_10